MTTIPFWIDSAPIKRFPALQKNVNVDVLVIGAGITGITTAYLLKKAGLTVALIERERVVSIDTGHTTAHLTFVTDVGLHELADNFGNDHAQAAWDAGAAATRSKELSRRKKSSVSLPAHQATCMSAQMVFPIKSSLRLKKKRESVRN
jgi:glycine/D-amino acid oxidase-like deaminating enzyme